MDVFLSHSAKRNNFYYTSFLPATQTEQRSIYCSNAALTLKSCRRKLHNNMLKGNEKGLQRLKARRRSMGLALKKIDKKMERRLTKIPPQQPSPVIDSSSDDEDNEMKDSKLRTTAMPGHMTKAFPKSVENLRNETPNTLEYDERYPSWQTGVPSDIDSRILQNPITLLALVASQQHKLDVRYSGHGETEDALLTYRHALDTDKGYNACWCTKCNSSNDDYEYLDWDDTTYEGYNHCDNYPLNRAQEEHDSSQSF